ncbi:hypothetical protein Ddye_016492 [Dipteronia dyeriana]|uniref:Uncharacterized protein n=1 Tax=Dipteronia dyeriana TaxID=168575 RepID=A0AAD9U7I3_9ROSI|nr:hypothetical protein Ddye_016492 [Dipteronia dyeriana]
MMSESMAAYEWLVDKDPHNWSMVYFKDTVIYDMLCNNMCEAFSKAILQAHDKPVVTIRNYLMKRLVKKKIELEKWKNDIGPNVFRVFEKLKMKSSICHPEYNGNIKFQVRSLGDEQYVVNRDTKTCDCKRWQLIWIPSVHGISSHLSSNRDPMNYIDYMYKKESFIKAYALMIYGISGLRMWPKISDKTVQCPQFKKKKGMRKKSMNLQSNKVRVGGKKSL